jgi:hypothetical protein
MTAKWLLSAIQPGSVETINTSELTAFKEMENIENFLTGCKNFGVPEIHLFQTADENFGVPKTNLFQTADLHQGQNIPQVISALLALEEKNDLKDASEREPEVRGWLYTFFHIEIPEGSLHEVLKDGVYLCKLINKIKPGSVKTINDSKMAFKQMENIENFLTGCKNFGVPEIHLFQTADLHQGQNIPQVIKTLLALRKVSGTW